MIVVDTCVLIDVSGGDAVWAGWATAQLDLWSGRGPLVINGIVYAELAAGFDDLESLEAFHAAACLELRPLSRGALFLAGRARALYKRRTGARAGLLADFSIGAQAADLGCPVLTRDTARFSSYFPGLQLIHPAPGQN